MALWSIDEILTNVGLRKQQTFGVAFSGGGARGFAHIGVMMALREFGIKPDVISGVSAGSIAAVLYAAGLTPLDIMDCFSQHGKFSDFTEFSLPKEGFFRLTKFAKILETWLPVKNLEELSIPTLVCATDFENSKAKAWAKGEIVPRVIASCSIPIVFTPKKIDGINYVDGGVLRNLPAWAIRNYCTTLIGSNCNPVDRKFKYKNSIIDVAMRSYHLMSKANAALDIKLCDIVIQTNGLQNVKTFGLSAMKNVVNRGYDAACRAFENTPLIPKH